MLFQHLTGTDTQTHQAIRAVCRLLKGQFIVGRTLYPLFCCGDSKGGLWQYMYKQEIDPGAQLFAPALPLCSFVKSERSFMNDLSNCS